MEPGIFTKVFTRSTLDETLAAVADAGFRQVQFNLFSAGLPSMPDAIGRGDVERIAVSLRVHDIQVAALSGTFNMAHPDAAVREEGVRRIGVQASICGALGTEVITICTGTRDRDDMWRAHPDNSTAEAWVDMRATVLEALEAVRPYGVRLGFEPEPGNVVRSPADGVRLMAETADPALGVVFDPANILASFPGAEPAAVMRDAIEALGSRVVLAHGKDLGADGEPCALGRGIIPWDVVINGLDTAGYRGPLVLHGLTEDEVAASLQHLADLRR